MRKILIIGGCGFVGSNLARYFAKTDKVLILDNLVRRGSEINLKDLTNYENISYIHSDIRNREDIKNIRDWDPDIILNCAAQPAATNYSNPQFDITNNCDAQVNVMEYCRDTKTPIIFWSTNKVYPATYTEVFSKSIIDNKLHWDKNNIETYYWSQKGFNEETPISSKDHSIYGASKAMADILTQEYSDAFGIPCILNRFSCLAGPNQWGKAEQGWVAWFVIAKLLGLPITFYGFDGAQVRDCLFTEDINRLIDLQMDKLLSVQSYTEVYNVGGGKDSTLSLKECLSKLSLIMGTIDIRYEVKEKRRADQGIYISDTTKLQSHFNWKPTISIDEGLKGIYNWALENREVLERLYK